MAQPAVAAECSALRAAQLLKCVFGAAIHQGRTPMENALSAQAPAFAGALERASKMVATLAEEPHVNPATGTQEFALCDPDGYYVMVSAETAA